MSGNYPLFDLTNGDPAKKVMVSVEDFPALLIMPQFGIPGSLTNGPLASDHIKPWHLLIKDSSAILKEKYGIETYSLPRINILSFARLLAKIGHAFAVAEMGLGEFEPVLLDLILGKAGMDVAMHFVGGEHEIEPPSQYIHELLLIPRPIIGGGILIQARIRLFASFGAPTYYVMVGKAKPNWQLALPTNLTRLGIVPSGTSSDVPSR